MKHLKLYAIALLALALFPSYSRAADAATTGKIQALIVSGDVKVFPGGAGNGVALKHNDYVNVGDVVKAGTDGVALLAFSNGATIRVTPNGQLGITKYTQAKFDESAEGTFLRLQKDPSTSETELDLRNGTLQGEVKKLNTNSKFTVNTPAGSAGIRGTVVSITVVRNAAGIVTGVVANCLTGSVDFKPVVATTTTTGTGSATTVVNTAEVGSGSQISVSIATDAAGNPTSATIGGVGLSVADANQALADVYTAINVVRAAEGLAPVAAPTVTSTSTPTVNGGSTVATVTVVIAPSTTPLEALAKGDVPVAPTTGGTPTSPNNPNPPTSDPTTITITES